MWVFESVIEKTEDAAGKWRLRIMLSMDETVECFFVKFDEEPTSELYSDYGQALADKMNAEIV